MILIVPFVVFMLAGEGEGWMKWAALAIFIAASLTDMLDGQIARKYNLITDFGKFMDPLADKLLVCSAMICLVDLDRLPAWICIVIIAREFAISGFRLVASDNGIVIFTSSPSSSSSTAPAFTRKSSNVIISSEISSLHSLSPEITSPATISRQTSSTVRGVATASAREI